MKYEYLVVYQSLNTVGNINITGDKPIDCLEALDNVRSLIRKRNAFVGDVIILNLILLRKFDEKSEK